MVESVFVVGVVAFGITLAITPLVIRFLIRASRMDVPNHRSSHDVPTPRGGGIGVVIGSVVASVVAVALDLDVPWPAIIGALVLAGVGYADDHLGLAPGPRLGAQAIVGLLAGLASGGVLGAIVGVVLVPVLVNAVNFMDGINGITGVTAIVWGLSAIVFGVVHEASVMIGVLALGTALGFLPWNLPRAKVFLGDVGSYFYGGILALGVLVGAFPSGGVVSWGALWWLLAPAMIYLADTGSTLVRRAKAGAKLTEAHREHIYQQLVDRPSLRHWHVSVTVGLFEVLCAVCGAHLVGILLVAVVCLGYVALPRIRARTTGEGLWP